MGRQTVERRSEGRDHLGHVCTYRWVVLGDNLNLVQSRGDEELAGH